MPPKRRSRRRRSVGSPTVGPQLEFTLFGSPEDHGLVRASAFVKFLADTLEALGKVERSTIGPKRSTLDYRIVELGIGSAVVAFEPIAAEEDDKLPTVVTSAFTGALEAAQRGKLDEFPLDPDTREAIEKLLAPPKSSGILSIGIRADGKEFSFVAADEPALKLHPPAEVSSVGSFAGFVDAVNVHKEPLFFLYPVAGPTRITCVFDRSELDQVRKALRRYVTVHGLAEYVAGVQFPHRIVVDRVDVHPEKPAVSIRDLVGIAPNLTGGRSAEEYIRSIRDARA